MLALILFIAAVIGDSVNYSVGKFLGPKAFQEKYSKIFRKEYLERTQSFFDRYGGKTIIIARFVPIVRTFAPFMAGIGSMSYVKFWTYNVVGATFWVGSLTYAGYFFSEIPIVKNNFGLVIIAIIIISLLPAVFEILRARTKHLST